MQKLNSGFYLPNRDLFVPNLLVEEGRTSFLKMIWQANDIDVTESGLFFIGLCGENGVSATATLLSINDELSTINGYARQSFARSVIGVPTLDVINGQAHIRSAVITFTATGGDFSGPYSRFFTCNIVSGSSGILYSFSAKIEPAIQILESGSQNVQFDMYW